MNLSLEKIKEMLQVVNGNYIVYESDDQAGLKVILISDGVAELFGYSKDEYETYIMSHNIMEVWGFEQEHMQSHINRHLIFGEDTAYTVQMPHKTEGYVWIRTKNRIIGEMNGRTIILVEMISAEDVARSIGGLMDKSSRGIYVMAKSSRKLLYVNDTYKAWVNKSRSELLRKKCYEVCDNCSEHTGEVCKNCIAMQAFQNGGKLEQELQTEDGSKFFNVECIQLKWGGHEAYAVMVSDVTTQKLVERDRLEKHYHRMDMPMNYLADRFESYFINLTENTAYTAEDDYEKAKGSYEDILQGILNHIASHENRVQAEEVLRRERLMHSFRSGKATCSVESNYVVGENDDRYVRFTACMSQNPVTKDVECVLYQEDISVPFLLNKVSEYVMDRAYLGLAVIDLKLEKFVPIDKNEGFNSLRVVLDYESALQGGAKENVVSSEQQMFARCGGLQNLRKQLAAKGTYYMMVHGFNEDGSINYARYCYSYLHRGRGIAICTMEDVTDDFEVDQLTGLFNFEGFAVRAQELLRREDKAYAVMFYNIKGFKAVNELFGNRAGDNVLKEVTRNLKHSGMNIELIGRIAVTDHFVFVVEQKNVDFEEIKRLCHLTINIDDKKISVHGRCGISYVNDRTQPIDRICDQAKLAKQHIEDAYVQPYAVFDEKMKEAYLFKTNAVSVVCQALENHEFFVYYQPIYDARTGKIASAEALVRWNRPDIGMISPGMFIPALEESGYISLVDSFVARNVRQFQEKRIAEGKKAVPVSVNLSWIDFYDDKTIRSVMEDIQIMENKENVSKLRYEVTETSWAAMNSKSSPMLQDMKQRGVKILLDDFGSGFSSFSTIRDYDFDILKIDMGFVQKLGKGDKVDGIVHAIIDMAHHIHADVVAEGVETDEQRRFLAENECDYLQGYYFSKPLPEAEFTALLDADDKS